MRLLAKPYPRDQVEDTYWIPPLTAIFVYLFLAFFQPFGISNIAAGWIKQLYLLGYGVITGMVMLITTIILPRVKPLRPYFDEERWTIGRHLFFSTVNVGLIALLNFLYSILVFGFSLNWTSFLFFLTATISLGLFPIVVIVLIKHNNLLRRNLQEASSLSREWRQHEQSLNDGYHSNDEIKLFDENGHLLFKFKPDRLYYVVADDNYLDLYLEDENKVVKSTLRFTLGKLEQHCSTVPFLVRCHRKYLVNLQQLEEVSGNAQGLRLKLKSEGAEVPVSRAMVPEIRRRLG